MSARASARIKAWPHMRFVKKKAPMVLLVDSEKVPSVYRSTMHVFPTPAQCASGRAARRCRGQPHPSLRVSQS